MKKILLFISFITLSTNAQTIALQSFATGFNSPVEITHPAGDSRLFVVQQGGIIKIVSPAGVVNTTPFLTLTTATISSGGERGLLGLAFHPNYATNGYFYLNYTRTGDGATVIARYSVSANPDIANTTGTILMTIAQPFSNHNGGTMKFGPDGYLYIGMGDGGSGGDPGNRAQNINENLGKMLRLDVDSASPYGIPPTNPFVGVAGNDEIWSIGMRNPWKFSFNRLNGDLWIADVGQDTTEEINKIPSPLPNTGLNFGWKCYEGSGVYDNNGCVPFSSTVAPFAEYLQSTTGGCSVTGGYFYTGSIPSFANKYFFADLCKGLGTINSTGVITWTTGLPGSSYTSFGEDRNGELYVASAGNGIVYKIYDATMGVSGFERNGFTLYPNPSNDRVFIKSTTDVALSKIELYDISGKLLMTERTESNPENSFVVSDLAKGMYLVAIETQSGNRYNTKLVVE